MSKQEEKSRFQMLCFKAKWSADYSVTMWQSIAFIVGPHNERIQYTLMSSG